MSKLQSICVFCGSASGNAVHLQSAKAMGLEIAKRKARLVYGGGDVGLMGELARTVLEASGDVYGVIPVAMVPVEVSGVMRGETKVVANMHQRKAAMAEAADCFVALPGGFGTLEELLEMVTWQSLGYHSKPVGLLNIDGFFDHLLAFFDHCVAQGFIKQAARHILVVSASPSQLIDEMERYVPAFTPILDVETHQKRESVEVEASGIE